MAYDGSLIFDTEIDTQGFEAGVARLQSAFAAMGEGLSAMLAGAGQQLAAALGPGLAASLSENLALGLPMLSLAVAEAAAGLAGALGEAAGPVQAQAAAMMQAVNSEIVAGGQVAAAAAAATAGRVVSALGPMAGGGAAVAGQMMAGMLGAMNGMAGALYQKANEIAGNIIATFNRAFAIRSPSRVMRDIFGLVMEGALAGLGKGEEALYRRVEQIAGGVVGGFGQLTGGAAAEWNRQLRAALAAGQPLAANAAAQGAATLAAPAAGAGGNQYTYQVSVSCPAPLDEAGLTREMEDMTRRMAWQIP